MSSKARVVANASAYVWSRRCGARGGRRGIRRNWGGAVAPARLWAKLREIDRKSVDDRERRRGNRNRRVVKSWLGAGILAMCVACGAPDLTFLDDVPDTGGGGSPGGWIPDSSAGIPDSSADAPVVQPCPMDMASVPTTTGGASYCVDAKEVTVAAYNDFLLASPSVSLLPPSCSPKTSFAPSVALDLAHPSYPVNNVDWCDAYAYCKSVGRRLCGRIGGGAPIGSSDFADATKSEWHNACSKGGKQAYPYGTSYVPQKCIDSQVLTLHNVGTTSGCVGGYPGLSDMSGNVQEWEDNCSTGSGLDDDCKTRGGSYKDGQTGLTCATTSSNRKRAGSDSSTGFRCCF
jgi:hypothetical protein